MGLLPYNMSRAQPEGTQQFTDSYSPGTWEALGGNFLGTDQLYVTVLAANSDTIDHTVSLFQYGAGTATPLVTSTVPAGAGGPGVPPVDLFDPIKAFFGFQGWIVPDGFTLQVAVGEAINTGKLVTVISMGGSLS